MDSQCHADVVKPALDCAADVVALLPEPVRCIEEKCERERGHAQQLTPKDVKTAEVVRGLWVDLEVEVRDKGDQHVPKAGTPSLAENRPLPAKPDLDARKAEVVERVSRWRVGK